MYEADIDVKLTLDEFFDLAKNISKYVKDDFVKNFDNLAFKWLVEYLSKGNNSLPDLDDNQYGGEYPDFEGFDDYYPSGYYSDVDILHVFEDKSGISLFMGKKYLHLSHNAENVEDYLLLGVNFDKELFIFMPKENIKNGI